MAMTSISDLMLVGMSYVLDFEERVAKAAPDVASEVSSAELKELFQKTGTKSKDYAKAVENAFGALGQSVDRKSNPLAEAMIGEMMGMIEQTGPGPVRDSALIVAANQQQQYRVASYGSLAAYAKLIGKEDALREVAAALDDSRNGDEKFSALAEREINPAAAKAA